MNIIDELKNKSFEHRNEVLELPDNTYSLVVNLKEVEALLIQQDRIFNKQTKKLKNQVIKNLNRRIKKSYDRMGSTGSDDYFETSTKQELIECGKCNALECFLNYMEKL